MTTFQCLFCTHTHLVTFQHLYAYDWNYNCTCCHHNSVTKALKFVELLMKQIRHVFALVLRTAAAKIMPVQSETKNSKWYSSWKWFSIFENFVWLYFFNYLMKISFFVFCRTGLTPNIKNNAVTVDVRGTSWLDCPWLIIGLFSLKFQLGIYYIC